MDIQLSQNNFTLEVKTTGQVETNLLDTFGNFWDIAPLSMLFVDTQTEGQTSTSDFIIKSTKNDFVLR